MPSQQSIRGPLRTKYPVYSQLAGNLGSETSSLETASSSGESANLRSRFRDDAVRATASKMRRCWLPGSALDENQKVGVELLLMGDRQSVGCAGAAMTSSPGAKSNTPAPTSSIVPATSAPRMVGRSGPIGTWPLLILTSIWLTDVASTRISAMPGRIAGLGTSVS